MEDHTGIRADVCKKLLKMRNVLYHNITFKVLYILSYLFICKTKSRSKYTNTLAHCIHRQLCMLGSQHCFKVAEYSDSGMKSITVDFHKTISLRKKVMKYLI